MYDRKEWMKQYLKKYRIRRGRTYSSWQHMKSRCNNPENDAYALYGGRGIRVCARWQEYSNFVADMGERPEGMSIDRIDNDKGYEPGNCRWATMAGQNQNQSITKLTLHRVRIIRQLHKYGGCTQKDLCKVFKISASHMSSLISGKFWPEAI